MTPVWHQQYHPPRHVTQAERGRKSDVATQALVTIGPDQDVQEARQLMDQHQLDRILVVQDDRLVGIVSEAEVNSDGEQAGVLVRGSGLYTAAASRAPPPPTWSAAFALQQRRVGEDRQPTRRPLRRRIKAEICLHRNEL